MSAKRRTQAPAPALPYALETATDRPLRIVAETTASDAEVREPAERGKRSKQSKTPKNKSAVKHKIVQAAPAIKPVRKAKAAVRKRTKKTVATVAENARPQLVPAEQASAKDIHMQMTTDPNADFTEAVSPVLVMPEDRSVEQAEAIAHAEASLDHIAEESCISAEQEATQPSPTDDAIADPFPVSAEEQEKPGFLQALASQWTRLLHVLIQTWNWTQKKLKSNQLKKRLRVCETVSLGDKRFIAVIQVDGEQFLVGGSSSSVATLAHLEPRREFSDVFRSRCEQDLSRA